MNGSYGFIIRDNNAHPIASGAGMCGAASALLCESIALRKGISEALRLGFSSIAVEGDNLSLINAVIGRWSVPWEIEMVVADILFDLRKFLLVEVRHVFREVNGVTDYIAYLPCSSLSSLRQDHLFGDLIRSDALGRPCSRS